MTAVIRTTSWEQDRDVLQNIRHTVFVEEQGVPEDLELDEKDSTALHFLALTDEGQPVATARLVQESDEIARIGRFAVLDSHRCQGIGNTLLQEIVRHAREASYSKLVLSAQLEAISFYEKGGFTPYGDIYLDAGIEHRSMKMLLTEDTD